MIIRYQDSATHILCVEDDEDCCTVERLLLQAEGYKVEVAQSISEALRLIRRRNFDMYLLDNWLIDGSGIELCQQIRVLYPHAPIIFFSGVVKDCDQMAAKDAGAQAYILKPDYEKLKLAVKCNSIGQV